MTGEGSAWSEEVTAVLRENPAIASAWARGQIRRLEDDYAAGLGDREALERSIIATSLRFGVLCRFTAYVAIDRAAVVNEGGKAHQITQPVEMPASWGGTRVALMIGRASGAVLGGAMPPAPLARFRHTFYVCGESVDAVPPRNCPTNSRKVLPASHLPARLRRDSRGDRHVATPADRQTGPEPQ